MRATLDRRVRDIMHYGVITVSENTNVSDMCRIMSDNRVSCVAVADHTREVVEPDSAAQVQRASAFSPLGDRRENAAIAVVAPSVRRLVRLAVASQ